MPYKNKEKESARKTAYRAAHKKEIAAYNAAYYVAHKEKIVAYAADRKKEKSRCGAAYRAAHPEAAVKRYFARKLGLQKDKIPPAALKLKTAIIAHARELKSLKGEKHA